MKSKKSGARVVKVYVLRHGHKDPVSGPNDLAILSREGQEQVLSSARSNLANIDFEGFYCSMKYRTLQTVVLAMSLFPKRNNCLGIEPKWGFDYSGAPNLGEKFNADKRKIEEIAKAQGIPVTIRMWHDVSPSMVNFLRSRLIKELKSIAIEHAKEIKKDEVNVLVGSHEIVGELACINSSEMFPLREADIVRYVIEVVESNSCVEAKIISAQWIDRGF